jgi:hypothetical protein
VRAAELARGRKRVAEASELRAARAWVKQIRASSSKSIYVGMVSPTIRSRHHNVVAGVCPHPLRLTGKCLSSSCGQVRACQKKMLSVAFRTHSLTQARDGQRFIRLFVLDPPEAGETRAVEAANRTLYGLTSSILAGDTYKAFELAPKILAGPSSTSTRRR